VTAPAWWYTLTGVAVALQILVLIVALVVAVYLVLVVRDLQEQVRTLGAKAQSVTSRIEDLTAHVQRTAIVAGGNVRNVTATVDALASSLSSKVEFVGALVIAFWAIRRALKRR
jgi:predicted PurR-regulated permease PerM